MSSFSDYSFLSSDGKTDIHVRCCTPDREIKGVVQLAHGIAEHIRRYDGFMEYLASKGFVAVGNDHLGHGESFKGEENLGFFAEENGWEKVISDMKTLHDMTARTYPGLPYFLFGHSMGSFLARTYIIRFRTGLTGAVICGTGQQAGALVAAGKLLSGIEIKKNGAKYKSELLNNIAFGNYIKQFDETRTVADWLSRDPEIVDKYLEDPLCGFIPTAGLFRDMMGGIEFISKASNIGRINKELPVLFISGEKDPVGENGKGVIRAYKKFIAAGISDVTLKLYPDCRHEILNEYGKEEVMSDVGAWLISHLSEV